MSIEPEHEELHDALGDQVEHLEIAPSPIAEVMKAGTALRARRRMALVSGVATLAVLPVAAVAVFAGSGGGERAGLFGTGRAKPGSSGRPNPAFETRASPGRTAVPTSEPAAGSKSLTPLPSVERAAIRSVAASAAPITKEKQMEDTETTEVETAEVVSLSAADITKAVSDGMAEAMKQFADTPRPVAAGRLVGLQVNEPVPYRFDGVRGAHDFSSDLIAGLGLGSGNPTSDGEAYERVLRFMGEALGPRFVDTGDTSAVNPTGYRADMFVDEQRFATPIYNAFYKGA